MPVCILLFHVNSVNREDSFACTSINRRVCGRTMTTNDRDVFLPLRPMCCDALLKYHPVMITSVSLFAAFQLKYRLYSLAVRTIDRVVVFDNNLLYRFLSDKFSCSIR